MVVSERRFEGVELDTTGCEEAIVVDCEADVTPRLRFRSFFSNALISLRTSASASSRFSTESSIEEKRTFWKASSLMSSLISCWLACEEAISEDAMLGELGEARARHKALHKYWYLDLSGIGS
jgi:hypothetical protein